jgi:sugar lactone lactonase YvrE
MFSDPSRNTVSQINAADNDAHTIAGSAVCSFAGDGEPASHGLLCFPEALFVNRDRELFIADTGNNRIRRIDLRTGIIVTVAGNGQLGDSGDGGPAVQGSLSGPMGVTVDNIGNIYVADSGNHSIRRVDAKTGIITTLATENALELASPSSLR